MCLRLLRKYRRGSKIRRRKRMKEQRLRKERSKKVIMFIKEEILKKRSLSLMRNRSLLLGFL
jgi:hypothetical protein